MIPDITKKIDNWLQYATAGQRGVLTEAKEEIERLRRVLVAVKDCLEDKNYIDAEMIIDRALQQKEIGQ